MTGTNGGMKDPRNRGINPQVRKGPISQDQLCVLMKPVIDAARSKAASRTRDDARALLRRMIAETNWNTPFVLTRLGTKRCRYLSSLGYIIEPKYLAASQADLDRINAWAEGRRG
jgi:hypothetical protein